MHSGVYSYHNHVHSHTGPGLALKGAQFPNHGVLRRDPSVIGEDEDALYCVTDDVTCCGTPPSSDCCGTTSSRDSSKSRYRRSGGSGGSGNGRGDWYFPGNPINRLLSGTVRSYPWYARWLTGAVLMNFHGTATSGTTGLYRCDIRDGTGTLHQLYTCVYDDSVASECEFTAMTVLPSVHALALGNH